MGCGVWGWCFFLLVVTSKYWDFPLVSDSFVLDVVLVVLLVVVEIVVRCCCVVLLSFAVAISLHRRFISLLQSRSVFRYIVKIVTSYKN